MSSNTMDHKYCMVGEQVKENSLGEYLILFC